MSLWETLRGSSVFPVTGMSVGHGQHQHYDCSWVQQARLSPTGSPLASYRRSRALWKTQAGAVGSQMCTSWGVPAAGILLFLQSKSAASVFISTDLAESLAEITSKHIPAFFHISSVT